MSKQDLKQLIKAFVYYGRGFSYVYWRYWVAPQLVRSTRSCEHAPKRDDLSIHMLVGKRDFLMGIWSLASLHRVMPFMGQVIIHSDGTLGAHETKIIHTLFPSARIENTKTFLKEHGHLLDQYPGLKVFRETYKKFQIRIIDQHFLSGKKYRLFLDSDLLWFKEPTEIVSAIEAGVPVPLMMSNSDYIRMEFRDGSETSDTESRPNGGIVLYREDQMDMGRMQAFLDKADYLGKRFGDQAWMAYTLRPTLLPETTYIIKGTLTNAIVVRHYTSPSRTKFYCYGLDRVAPAILKEYVRN